MKYNYGEMIHRYLDGMLPEDLEHQLFDELARNPELRRSFGMELDIQKAATADSATLIPPENIRENVFSALDIPLAADAPMLAPAAPQLLTFTSIALVSMIFGGIMVWFGMQGQAGLNQQFTAAATPPPTSVFQTPRASLAGNVNSPDRLSGKSSRDNSSTTPRISPTMQAENLPENTETSHLYQALPAEPLGIPSDNSLIYTHHQDRNGTVALAVTLPQFLDIPPDIPMSVSMRGAQDISGTSGVALTALYSLDDEQALGIEVSTGQILRYEQRRTGGIDKQITISEQATIIGSVYRTTIPSISIGDFTPYLQSFAGATTKGLPVGRTTLGLQWTPDSRVTLSGGLDGTLYGYRANGQWKAGVMTSLVYGVSVVL